MAKSSIKGRAWTRKEDEAWVSEDSVKGSSQTSEGIWTHPPQERFGPMPVFGSNTVGNEQENGKAKEELAFQEEMASSLRLMVEQIAIAMEERKRRHKERAKQIKEEMDDRNMERNTKDYTLMSKAYFDRKKRGIMTQRELSTSDYTPTMVDEDDDYSL
ncbi:hypothetical protein D8674_010356 [Pyrus ussuriensis x Pyrus communis]|uniref:Uncharacterized protein n=1 Tax=Pyrus ussuriensis x Pyrus communis TaxID=2448454 RepID=A0A5N5FAI6_9ROSA|nr:hypothetical protein D8674_010356 [Pyrus ussuriensis x Pyrus communis]